MNSLRRRLLAGCAAAGLLPRRGFAQRSARRLAWFAVGDPETELPYVDALVTGLRQAGWEEGRNLQLSRFRSERAPEDFDAVVKRVTAANPEVVVAQEYAALAMLRFAPHIPTVFGFSGDPVEAKLVKSLARPQTNFTGVSYLASELVGKRIEFLKEALPAIQRVGILARPQHPGEPEERRASEQAAAKLGLEVAYFPIYDPREIEKAFAGMRAAKCDALVVFPDFVMYKSREHISQLAAIARLPAVSGWSSFADSGLLFNYGPNLRDIYRTAASYVDRILRGARAADLPVERPRTIELVVNLRTARALGVTVTQPILVRANRVIE